MKNYFKRLKSHPGLSIAVGMTILSFTAAITNKTVHSIGAALILGSIASAFFWCIVLITNFKR